MNTGIVIVTYECRAFALACLESVRERTPALLQSTVVVDNASTDGTAAAVRTTFPSVRVLSMPRNLGFATGVNAGIRALPDAGVICLLNPDSTLLDDGIFSAAAFLETNPEFGIAGGRVLNADGSVQLSVRAFPSHKTAVFNRHSLATRFLPGNRWSRDYLMSSWAHDEVREVDWVSGAFMFIHRRALDAVGLLDEGYFFSIEDVDYCRRAHDAGLKVAYYPHAAIQHRIGGSSRKAVYRAMAAHHRGMWRYYRRHLRGNLLVDLATAAAITGRFALHATSYALRTARNRVLRRRDT